MKITMHPFDRHMEGQIAESPEYQAHADRIHKMKPDEARKTLYKWVKSGEVDMVDYLNLMDEINESLSVDTTKRFVARFINAAKVEKLKKVYERDIYQWCYHQHVGSENLDDLVWEIEKACEKEKIMVYKDRYGK